MELAYLLTNINEVITIRNISKFFNMRRTMATTFSQNALMFKALSDPIRLEILDLLSDGEKCACVLIERLGIAQPSVSYHTNILFKAGLIHRRQEGKWAFFSINEQGFLHACQTILAITKLDKHQTLLKSSCCSPSPSPSSSYSSSYSSGSSRN